MTRSRLSIDLLSQECDLPFKGAVKMYPILRMAKELIKTSLASKLKVTDVHVSHHICWPWDLDMFAELNNGRTLTLFDLSRFGLAQRTGVTDVLRKHKWGLTTAGASTR